jgi:4-amino-4-deoxy-L-arabinose transferase-like glycosyltransferase
VDSATAALVVFIGSRVFDRRTGFIAGLIYAASPLALVSAVRVGQDPLLTALGSLAVALLLVGPERRWAIAAGVCLGIAVWIKYPAVYFMPVCLLLSPRRFPFVVVAATGALAALLFPFGGQIHALYTQTVTFQHTRWTMALNQRLATTALFWIGLNILALPALVRRVPAWLLAGFLLGGLFVFSPQVYYHYFVPVVPFAALLAGYTIARFRIRRRPMAAAMLLSAVLTAGVIGLGGHSPFYVTAARFSEVEPTVELLDQKSSSREAVLADRFEYAYLAHRPDLAHYFWNVGVLVNAAYLERRVHAARAVVLSSGASSGYPAGFTAYLNEHYNRVRRPTTYVWLLPRTALR